MLKLWKAYVMSRELARKEFDFMNTPKPETKRLILRKDVEEGAKAPYTLLADELPCPSWNQDGAGS